MLVVAFARLNADVPPMVAVVVVAAVRGLMRTIMIRTFEAGAVKLHELVVV